MVDKYIYLLNDLTSGREISRNLEATIYKMITVRSFWNLAYIECTPKRNGMRKLVRPKDNCQWHNYTCIHTKDTYVDCIK